MVRGALPDTFKSVVACAGPVSWPHTGSWGLLGPSTRASIIPKAHPTSNLKANARAAVAIIREYIYIYIYVSTNFWKKARAATSSMANDCMNAC